MSQLHVNHMWVGNNAILPPQYVTTPSGSLARAKIGDAYRGAASPQTTTNVILHTNNPNGIIPASISSSAGDLAITKPQDLKIKNVKDLPLPTASHEILKMFADYFLQNDLSVQAGDIYKVLILDSSGGVYLDMRIAQSFFRPLNECKEHSIHPTGYGDILEVSQNFPFLSYSHVNRFEGNFANLQKTEDAPKDIVHLMAARLITALNTPLFDEQNKFLVSQKLQKTEELSLTKSTETDFYLNNNNELGDCDHYQIIKKKDGKFALINTKNGKKFTLEISGHTYGYYNTKTEIELIKNQNKKLLIRTNNPYINDIKIMEDVFESRPIIQFYNGFFQNIYKKLKENQYSTKDLFELLFKQDKNTMPCFFNLINMDNAAFDDLNLPELSLNKKKQLQTLATCNITGEGFRDLYLANYLQSSRKTHEEGQQAINTLLGGECTETMQGAWIKIRQKRTIHESPI